MENKPLSSPSLLQTTAALFGEGEKIPSENPCGEARGAGGGVGGGVQSGQQQDLGKAGPEGN